MYGVGSAAEVNDSQARRGWAIWVRLYNYAWRSPQPEALEGRSPLILWLRA